MKSAIPFGGGYKLTLNGELIRKDHEVSSARWRGDGVPGTPTEGWIYEYEGVLTQRWPNGVGQAQVIVGSVIRAAPHGNAPAGYVASFYMVRHS